jgi:predicted nuclease of predicted toxin-antitoxin system
MILADENIDHSIITCLRDEGIEVYSIYENQRGTTDLDIVALSRNLPRIILTEDKDFADIVFAYQTKGISVILLRYAFDETAQITKILVNFLKNKTEDVWGKFVTITTSKIRIRAID